MWFIQLINDPCARNCPIYVRYDAILPTKNDSWTEEKKERKVECNVSEVVINGKKGLMKAVASKFNLKQYLISFKSYLTNLKGFQNVIISTWY